MVKLGRNAACPCGSGKKFKKCHGRKLRPLSKLWTAKLIEDVVLPNLRDLRVVSLRECLDIYRSWASSDVYDREDKENSCKRCSILENIAKRHLREIAALLPKRIFLQALRSTPISAVCFMTQIVSDKDVLALIIDGTIALSKWAAEDDRWQPGVAGDHFVLRASPEDVLFLQKTLGPALARLVGALLIRREAEMAYRYAGKGGLLKKIVPFEPIKEDLFESFKTGIVVMPSPEFEINPELERCVALYDERRKKDASTGLSGFLEVGKWLPLKSDVGWWNVGIGPPVRVDYPQLGIFGNGRFLLTLCDASGQFERIRWFSDKLPECFGLSCEEFLAACQAVVRLILEEAALDLVEDCRSDGKETVLRSRLESNDPRSASAPQFLSQALNGAMIRGGRKSLALRIGTFLSKAGSSDAKASAEKFLDCFSAPQFYSESMTPALFVPVDEDLIMIDFLLMSEFLDLSLRVLTEGTGPTGEQRGGKFEEEARKWLMNELGLSTSELPVVPNTKIKEQKRDVGDVDLAFWWEGVLVNVDMKSWQRSEEYFRGDYGRVRNRQSDLSENLMKKLEKRGEILRERLPSPDPTKPVLVANFLCTPAPEFIDCRYENLWYGDVPRVLTPKELVALLNEPQGIRQLKEEVQRVDSKSLNALFPAP